MTCPSTLQYKKNDEYYTNRVMVDPILPYIPEGSTVWCPFDTPESEYVKAFQERHKVLYSHIWEGKDFLTYEPDEEYDYIVSNPPYSIKEEVMYRLEELSMPYAMFLPVNQLSISYLADFWMVRNLQLLILNRRIPFFPGGRPPFAFAYFCEGILPKDLIITDISGSQSSRLSEMYEVYGSVA